MNGEVNGSGEVSEANETSDVSEYSELEDTSAFENESDELSSKMENESDSDMDSFKNLADDPNEEETRYAPNSYFKDEDGVKNFTDDNGQVYRKENRLLPDTAYDINGYHYETDDQGRIVSAEGKLQSKDHDDRYTMDTKEYMDMDYKDTDDRGHLIADRFNGSGRVDNVVPMDSSLNQKEYKQLENELGKAVDDGKEVYVSIEAVYDDENSDRPTSFVYMYQIDGEVNYQEFKNTKQST